jgi:hypothetical protein
MTPVSTANADRRPLVNAAASAACSRSEEPTKRWRATSRGMVCDAKTIATGIEKTQPMLANVRKTPAGIADEEGPRRSAILPVSGLSRPATTYPGANKTGEDRSIRPVQTGLRVDSAQHGDFVTQHQELNVLGRRRAGEQQQQVHQLKEDQVKETQRHGSRSCPGGRGHRSPRSKAQTDFWNPTSSPDRQRGTRIFRAFVLLSSLCSEMHDRTNYTIGE